MLGAVTVVENAQVNAVLPQRLRIIESFQQGRVAAAVRTNRFQRQQLHVPIHTDHAGGVVSLSADRAGHMSAVRVSGGIIEDRAVVVYKIPTIDVINKSVAVVVDVVTGNLAGVYEDVVLEIAMLNVDS